MLRTLTSGITLGYDEAGSGLPLLLIHGFPHNRSMWSEQVGELQDEARCIAVDLRGFGESQAKPPYSIHQYADDVVELLRELGVDRAVVCGLSMGGYVALDIWRRHPALVHALILADTRAEPDSDEGRAKRNQLIDMVRSSGTAALADAQVQGMLGKSTRSQSPDLVSKVHELLASAQPAGAIGALEAMRDRPDSTELLDSINVPVLIVVGDEDVLTPPRDAQRMHDALPGSRLEIIHGAGHMSNVERPRQFNQAVGSFLYSLLGS